MKHLLFFLLAFPFLASAQILEKQFVATVQYNGFTQINDSLYRGDLIEFRDVLIEGYQPSGVDSGFICLDGTGRAYRVEVVNSFDYSSLNVDLIELDDYDEIPTGVGIVAERYGSTYQIPNGLVNSIGISAVLQAKILNHNTKIAATTVQPPDTLYLQELSGTTAISNGDTIPLIDYVRVVDTPAILLNYPSTAGYGIIDGGKTWRADTTAPSGLATRKYALLNPTSILADRLVRSNGSNLAAGTLTDNGTKLQALLPWQFQTYTTAGLPTGVTGYHVYNTTTNGPGWYQGSRWAYGLESTFNRGTATRVPFFDANGQVTDNANLYYSSGSVNVWSGSDRAVITPSNGSGRPMIQLFNAGQMDLQITADNDASFGMGGSAYINGALILSGGLYTATASRISALQVGVTQTYANQEGSIVLAPNGGTRPFINFTERLVSHKGNLGMTTGNPGDLFFETNPTSSNTPQSGTQRFRVNGSTGRFGVGAGSTINYSLEQLSQTDAFGVARGTVAQRPTIASSTTPLRFNIDSTALEYGESVGTWRQIATRAYARSLVFGLPTTNIYTADGTLAGNRTITSGGFNLRYTGNFSVGSSSAPARTLDVTGEARVSDLTTDIPTRIVGADADGDLGEMTTGRGVSIVAGVLGLSTDSLEQNAGVLYVSKNGNNSTAKRNNPRLPFLTIKAAVTASSKGDLIYIYPGIYYESGNTLGRDSINFYCSPGATVSNAVITDDYGLSDMDNGGYIRWFGSGIFDSCTVSIQHTNMRYHIEGDSINLNYVPFWKGSNYNDVRLKFKFRSVRTRLSQLVWLPGASSELSYTRLNLIFEIDRIFSNESSRLHPLIHFSNGAGGIAVDAKSKFIDCNFLFSIKNIELSGSSSIGTTPRIQGLVFGAGAAEGRVYFQRSSLTFSSDVITQTGSSGNTYQTPFQGLENSNALFGVGTFKLDSSRLNFNIKSIISDLHAFRIGEFYQGNKGAVNINGNFTTRELATFHVEETGSSATGDTSILIRVNGNFSSDKEVVTCRSTVPIEKITWQGNYTSFGDKAVFAIKSDKFTLSSVLLKNNGTTADVYAAEARTIKIANAFSENLIISSNVTANWLDNIGNPKYFGYGVGAKEASDLSKTGTNWNATFATDGTVLEIERKRDTTIFVDDADYDFSAAITTAQIASRFNRVIFWMTTTAGAGSDSELTLHTPDINLMQVEYLIHSVDEAGGFSNKIVFGTNNAVDSTNGLVTNYYPSAGQGVHIRAGLRSAVYKYRYSN